MLVQKGNIQDASLLAYVGTRSTTRCMSPSRLAFTLIFGSFSLIVGTFVVLSRYRSVRDAVADAASVLELAHTVLSDAPLWASGLILVGLTNLCALLVWPWLRQQIDSKTNTHPSATTTTAWATELHHHRVDRREFWRLLETAYAHWAMNPEPHRSLREMMRGAQIPTSLPLADSSKFPDWSWRAEDHCTGDAMHLLQFASVIYVAAKPPMVVKSQLMGSSSEFDRFDTIRMELAKFWDHWGRQEPLEQVIREQKADGFIKAHASEIKLLTFLEVARVRWAGSDTPGKSGLFRMGRRNVETGS